MKTLYLVLKRYSRYFLKEAAIILQVMIISFALVYALSYVFETSAKSRYIHRAFGCDAFYFTFHDIYQEEAPLTPRDLSQDDMWAQALDTINNLPGLSGTGSARNTTIQIADKENPYELTMYSTDLIKNVKMPVAKGRWFNDTEALGIDSRNVIPVVLSDLWNGQYAVGDVIDIQTQEDHMGVSQSTIKVIGILSRDALPFKFFYGGTRQTISHLFGHETDIYYPAIICPPLLKNGKWLDERYFMVECNMLLFSENAAQYESQWAQILTEYGDVTSVNDMMENDKTSFALGAGDYFMHGLMAFLLMIVGVSSYNVLSLRKQRKMFGIYIMSGMTRLKAFRIALLSNGFLFFAAGIIGILLGNMVVKTQRDFMTDTQWMACIFTALIVFVLYALTSIGIVVSFLKHSPTELILKGGTDND